MTKTWDLLVAEAHSIGYTVEIVEYCESADSPGFLGAGVGVCIKSKSLIRIKESLTEVERVGVLEHELGHARAYRRGEPREWHKKYDAEWWDRRDNGTLPIPPEDY